MPLRDHFHPPVSRESSWHGLYGGWPAVIVQKLHNVLPEGFAAGPLIRFGAFGEECVEDSSIRDSPFYSPDVFPHLNEYPNWLRAPALREATPWGEFSDYEVQVRNRNAANQIVALIALVSPGSKRSAAGRRVFLTKCMGAMLQGIAVTMIDVVTSQRINLYHEFLSSLGHSDPSMSVDPPCIYAASVRLLVRKPRSLLECWSEPLILGQRLPTFPLWLDETQAVPLDLERSYEQTCHDLRIE